MKFRSQRLELREIEPGIVELQFHSPHSANILNNATLKSLHKALHIVQVMPAVKGMIITSDKPHFMFGADLHEIQSLLQLPPKELTAWLKETNTLFNQYQDLPFPTVSVISGHALGGGFEFTLATDFRVADASAIVGLPMMQLGITPGLGGSVRLSRLIGIEKTVNVIAKHFLPPASCALKLGMIDRVSDKENLLNTALLVLKEAINNPANWQNKRAVKQAPVKTDKNEDSLHVTNLHKIQSEKVTTHYPAIKTVIETVIKSAELSFSEALESETAAFLELAYNHQTKALIRVNQNEQFIKNRNLSVIGKNTHPTSSLGVFGANITGSELALAATIHDIPTRLNDESEARLFQGKQFLDDATNGKVQHHHLTVNNRQKLSKSISLNRHYSGFAKCEVVIESLNETMESKVSRLHDLEQNIQPDTVLITNTSSLSVSSLSDALRQPERYCGIHLPHPASNTKLVEVIKGKYTSMETLQTVIQLMNQLGKQPLLIQEQPGLFTSRILLTYLSSFCNLASEGVSVSYIDNLMEQEFGWAKGPGKLIDIIGVDVVYRAIQNLNKNYPDRIYASEHNLLASLNHQSLTGIKSLSGFYQYKKDATEKHHTIGLSSAVKNFLSQPNKKITAKEIIYRLMLPMMNEVVRCLEEEVISTPEEGDFALVHGIGFPAFRGGVFHQIDQLTLPSYLAILSQYKKYGAAYHPPTLLLDMQEKALPFYPTSISAHSA